VLAEAGYNPAYGARPLQRVVQSRLQDPLAEQIVEGAIVDGQRVDVTAAERAPAGGAALARAAAAVGADGVAIGVDDKLDGLSSELDAVAAAVGRRMAGRRIRYVGAGAREAADPARRWRRQ